jgi:hypothetical protein
MLNFELAESMRATVFSSGLLVTPRMVAQLAGEMSTQFHEYYQNRDDGSARLYGGVLAHQGLGPRTILNSCTTLSRLCRQQSNPVQDLPDVAGGFISALLEGYIAGREEKLLAEQERTLRAHLAAAGH